MDERPNCADKAVSSFKKNTHIYIFMYLYMTRPLLCCSALIKAQTHSQEEAFKALSGTKSKVKGWNNDEELWGRIPLGRDNSGAWGPYNNYLLIINIWIDQLTVCSGRGRRWLDKEENKPHRTENIRAHAAELFAPLHQPLVNPSQHCVVFCSNSLHMSPPLRRVQWYSLQDAPHVFYFF